MRTRIPNESSPLGRFASHTFLVLALAGPLVLVNPTAGAAAATAEVADPSVEAGNYLQIGALPFTFVSRAFEVKPLNGTIVKVDGSGSVFSAVDPVLTFRAGIDDVVARARLSSDVQSLQIGYRLSPQLELGGIVEGGRQFTAEQEIEVTQSRIFFGLYGHLTSTFDEKISFETEAQALLATGKSEQAIKPNMNVAVVTESVTTSGFALVLRGQLVRRLTTNLDFCPSVTLSYRSLTQKVGAIAPNAMTTPPIAGSPARDVEVNETDVALIPLALRLRF